MIATIVWIVLCPLTCHATPLIADLSNYRIDIDSGFNGTRIFLFGARNDIGDVVVVIRGPAKNYMVRKKEEVAGIWINSDRMKFYNVPDFYAVASSRPLADIETPLLHQLGIGEKSLLSPPSGPLSQSTYEEFSEAFLRYQNARKLYHASPVEITFMGETLFKATIEFPDNIPSGNYTAEIYLISDGTVTGMQSMPVTVVKSGLDAFVYDYAHQSPLLYGLTAVVLALTAGWFAGRIFEKI